MICKHSSFYKYEFIDYARSGQNTRTLLKREEIKTAIKWNIFVKWYYQPGLKYKILNLYRNSTITADQGRHSQISIFVVFQLFKVKEILIYHKNLTIDYWCVARIKMCADDLSKAIKGLLILKHSFYHN